MPLTVEPILPRFGAVCTGLDLTRKLSPDEVTQVTNAMDTWGVTVWPDTGMNDEQHIEFSRNFGFLERVPKREGAKMRLPYRELFDASNLNAHGEITQDPAAIQYRKGDRLWHTDSAFLEKRTSYSILLAHEVPPEGGETSFADTRSAYEDLPQEMKDFLEGKVGINSLWWSRKMAGADIADEEIYERPVARHPLVHVHKGSGRKALFIAAHTMDVEGMPKEEGRALIVAINKWDVAEDASALFNGVRAALDEGLAQLKGVPLLAVSALTGKGLDQMLAAAFEVREAWSRRVPTAALNRWFDTALEANPPPAPGGRRIKLRYITQSNTRPPRFVIFGTRLDDLPTSYERYLLNGIRRDLGFGAVPVRLTLKSPKNPFSKG